MYNRVVEYTCHPNICVNACCSACRHQHPNVRMHQTYQRLVSMPYAHSCTYVQSRNSCRPSCRRMIQKRTHNSAAHTYAHTKHTNRSRTHARPVHGKIPSAASGATTTQSRSDHTLHAHSSRRPATRSTQQALQHARRRECRCARR